MRLMVFAAALLLAGCATVPEPQRSAIGEAEMRATIAVLASDEFEGRMAGTPGEAKAIAYIAERFRAAGLASGARGLVPYLDPFAIIAKLPAKPSSKPPAKPATEPKGASGQKYFTAQRERMGNLTSHNVIGIARGRRPDGKAVVLMGHWDHLGLCLPAPAADRICNGANDNASGIAAMIAIAEQVSKMGLDRDVWFVATGAEEWGLLGARAFAAKPPLPLATIVAGFNLDMIAIAPPGAKVVMVAPPASRLEALVKDVAAAMRRPWDGDHEADAYLRRQDGWALAERGVPMVMVGGGFSDLTLVKRFLGGDYHGPDDELRPDTELGGAVEDANLHLELVRRAASRHFNPGPLKVPMLGR